MRDKPNDLLNIDKFLNDAASLPWCGDADESLVASMLPTEPLPPNQFFAQARKTFGIDAHTPLVGAVGVIRCPGALDGLSTNPPGGVVWRPMADFILLDVKVIVLRR
ncbi:hypothetical protein ACFSE1_16735 [Rhizobium helianthi]|uniref:Uncharacterized protein n=1 Tax=Rhizobium helianthi TaxID=1132695 RepID=A0ABW4M8Q3_9HYPH